MERALAPEVFAVSPGFVPIPNVFLDFVLPQLPEGEGKVLCYLLRRTVGFGKEADEVSLGQFTDGIVRRDGRRLDLGCGLKRKAVLAALNRLLNQGLISKERNRAADGGDEASTYRVRMDGALALAMAAVADRDRVVGPGGVAATPPGASESAPRGTPQGHPQETAIQETDDQETGFDYSKGPTVQDFPQHDEPAGIAAAAGSSPTRDGAGLNAREALRPFVADFARELGDRAPLTSSLSRATNVHRRSGLALADFVDCMYAARATTQERTASIRGTPAACARTWGPKAKMAYYFAVLEDAVGLQVHRPDPPPSPESEDEPGPEQSAARDDRPPAPEPMSKRDERGICANPAAPEQAAASASALDAHGPSTAPTARGARAPVSESAREPGEHDVARPPLFRVLEARLDRALAGQPDPFGVLDGGDLLLAQADYLARRMLERWADADDRRAELVAAIGARPPLWRLGREPVTAEDRGAEWALRRREGPADPTDATP